ncbi:MAG: hypothetical protein J07HQW2_00239 [Haloquadratum walsbyi J07HQW2]|uniref:Uncharacterized protein n=1 Tax=Haloquadratum walsbyi J07HQW2 TaxID=1238425 RepID=U1NAF2_9EURY|nr:MAG: hypothetical protein J07HQW2_00239 [Haloquadratum walsbyi J07HQW2]
MRLLRSSLTNKAYSSIVYHHVSTVLAPGYRSEIPLRISMSSEVSELLQ